MHVPQSPIVSQATNERRRRREPKWCTSSFLCLSLSLSVSAAVPLSHLLISRCWQTFPSLARKLPRPLALPHSLRAPRCSPRSLDRRPLLAGPGPILRDLAIYNEMTGGRAREAPMDLEHADFFRSPRDGGGGGNWSWRGRVAEEAGGRGERRTDGRTGSCGCGGRDRRRRRSLSLRRPGKVVWRTTEHSEVRTSAGGGRGREGMRGRKQ